MISCQNASVLAWPSRPRHELVHGHHDRTRRPLEAEQNAAERRFAARAKLGAATADPKEDDGNRWFLSNAFFIVSSCVDLREDVVSWGEETVSSFFYALSLLISLPHQQIAELSL